MAPLSETGVYIASKLILEREGWELLAGDPPSGSDHLPALEIKWAGRTQKGSLGAFKPDLVAFKSGVILIVECKPDHDEADAAKLREVLESPDRAEALHREMSRRSLWSRHGLSSQQHGFAERLRGGLAHSGDVVMQPDLAVLSVDSPSGDGRLIPPTDADPALAAVL